MTTKVKSFDCVAMKHAAAQRIQRGLSGKGIKQKIAYWKLRQQEMLSRQTIVQQKMEKAS